MQQRQQAPCHPYRTAGQRTVYHAAAPQQQRRRRRKKKKRHPGRLLLGLVFCVGVGVLLASGAWRGLVPKVPGHYTIALDAGHGGADMGATGLISEVDLTETTVRALLDPKAFAAGPASGIEQLSLFAAPEIQALAQGGMPLHTAANTVREEAVQCMMRQM